MLFTELDQNERIVVAREAWSLLKDAGANPATKHKITRGNMSIRYQIVDGVTATWNEDRSAVHIIRWAKGDQFGYPRRSSAKVYEKTLVDAGFIVEFKDNALRITGKVAA